MRLGNLGMMIKPCDFAMTLPHALPSLCNTSDQLTTFNQSEYKFRSIEDSIDQCKV